MLNVLTRSWARRALASSVCGVLLFCADADAQLLVPTPDHDAFYRVPGNVAGFGNGAVLGSRPITAMVGPLPLPAKAWQVKYKTLGTHGEPTSTVTTVLVPTAEWKGAGPRPLVSLQSAEDGVGARCAPSYALRAGVQAAATPSQVDLAVLVPLLLAKGWAVVVPDHEGVRHEFASARMSAHAVLDGIRTAQRFAPAAVGPAAPVAMFGYSGGGWATDLAAQLHRSYAPELRFVGIAAGGVPADIRALYRNANGSPYGGAVLMLFVGLARAYPEARLEQELNAAGRQAVAAGQADCLLDAVVRNPGLDLRRFVAAAGIDRLLDLQWRNSPLSLAGVPQEPVYAFHGIDDELIPFAPGRALAEHYCAAGVRVLFRGERGGGHFGDGALGAPGAISFLADRFAGKPAPDNCPPGSRKAAVRPACRSTRRIVPIDGRRRSVRVVRKYRMCWSAS